MKNFINKWSVFLSIVFGPGSVIFILLTLIGLVLAYYFKGNVLFATLLSILSSVFAGIAGNFIKDDYDTFLGKNTLEKKGKSALRNLQTISTQLCNLRVWISDFQKDKNKNQKDPLFNEIDRHISTIQLNITSGLEDWVDIVPELKEKIQENAEIEKKYKDLAQSYFNELLEKRKELILSNDKIKTEELKEKINNLEKQMKSLRSEQVHASGPVSISGGYGGRIVYNDPARYGSMVVPQSGLSCSRCGKKFITNNVGLGLIGSMYCDNCRKEIGL